jgi:hypothetical protein
MGGQRAMPFFRQEPINALCPVGHRIGRPGDRWPQQANFMAASSDRRVYFCAKKLGIRALINAIQPLASANLVSEFSARSNLQQYPKNFS